MPDHGSTFNHHCPLLLFNRSILPNLNNNLYLLFCQQETKREQSTGKPLQSNLDASLSTASAPLSSLEIKLQEQTTMITEGNEFNNNKMSVTEPNNCDSTVHTCTNAHSHKFDAKQDKSEAQSIRKHTQKCQSAGKLLLNTACQYQEESSFDRGNMLRSVAVRGVNQVHVS